MDNERGKGSIINLMSQFTYDSLLREAEEIRNNVNRSLLDIGEAAGSGSDWHDNAAFDHANMRHDVESLQLRNIQAKLTDVEIIKPSIKIDQVNIGNSVIVKFHGENENETFTILGPSDARRHEGWISFESALGSNLIGKKKGEIVVFASEKQELSITIVDILPGDF